MSIRLNALKNYNTTSVNSVSKSKDEKTSAVSTKNDMQVKADKVSITASAGDFSAAKVQTKISANVNSLSSSDRINEIKKQIAEGTYNVTSEDIAESILDRFA